MRVFLNQPFVRFARREGIEDSALLEAVARADRGLIDADMGSGLVKQRVPRPNEGRSGGYRCLLAYRREHVTVFIHGFAKNERDNISPAELRILRELAKEYWP